MNPSSSRVAAGLAACIFTFCSLSAAQAAPIVLDGAFDDWAAVSVAVTDGSGDDGGSGIDFGRVWTANDDRYLFLRFETGAEVQGDEQQAMRLYLDTDMNANTGTSYDGIGADLVFDFGDRRGTFRGSTIYHDDIGLLLGPTVSSTEFEIALALDATPNGQALFPGDEVRWILRDMDGGGDRVPNSGAQLTRIEVVAADDPAIPLTRFDDSHLRVAAYNVLSDGIFDGGSRQAAYERILPAIDADVWVFNEVWNNTANDTAARLEQLLPAGDGSTWDAVKLDQGNVIVSRYPILQSWEIFPGARLTGALIDLDPDHDRDVLVIAAHFSCCTADANRQDQADALIAFVRDAQTPGGLIDLPADTPIVAAGDFNLVGWRQQLDTILTGDIQQEGEFGADHAPDWDGSTFDLPPSTHTDLRVGYTWNNPNSSFFPGLLDFVFVTESVAPVANHFVFDTRTMRPATLAAYGLQAGDTPTASDHNPRVADLVLTTSTNAPALAARLDLQVAPNPFNPSTTVSFELESPRRGALEVFDVNGRHVRTLLAGELAAGRQTVTWDGRDSEGRAVASGVYLVRLRAGDASTARKVSLVE